MTSSASRPSAKGGDPGLTSPSCGGAVTLGSTSSCVFAAAGTATYTVALPAATVLRVRSVVSVGSAWTSTGISPVGGANLCSTSGYYGVSCVINAAGSYEIRISTPSAATVVTTLDSLTSPASCPDVSVTPVTAAATTVTIDDAGEWACGTLDVPSGTKLLLRDWGASDNVSHTVIDAAGVERCTVTVYTSAGSADCDLTGTSPFRLLTAFVGAATDTFALRVVKVDPVGGCSAAGLDDFGAAPSRSGTVADGAIDCSQVTLASAGALWLTAAVSATSPEVTWQLRAADGTLECSGGSSQGARLCNGLAAGTFSLLVRQAGPDVDPADYSLAVSAVGPAGCTSVTSLDWDAPASAGSLAVGPETDCFSVTATTGQQLRVWLGGDAEGRYDRQVAVVNAAGTQVCQGSYVALDCTLTGTGPYRALVWSSAGKAASYELHLNALWSSIGCTAITTSDFGTAPVVAGSISVRGETDCYALTTTANADVLVRMQTSSGTLRSGWEVRAPDGSSECYAATESPVACALGAAGTYVLLAHTANGIGNDETGGYQLGTWRLDPPTGCASASDLAFGAAPVTGSTGDPGQVDCLQVSMSSGDMLRARAHVPSGGPTTYLAVVNAAGTMICSPSNDQDCSLTGSAPFRVIAFRTTQGTGDYTVRLTKLNNPTGCTTMTATAGGAVPATDVVLLDPAEEACVTFTGGSFSSHETISATALEASTPASFEVLRPNGVRLCSGNDAPLDCTVPAPGTYAVVVSSYGIGSFRVGWWEFRKAQPCADLGTLGFGEAPSAFDLTQRGEVDCAAFVGKPADRIDVRADAQDPGTSVSGWVVNGAGQRLCSFSSLAGCTLTGAGPYRILTWSSDGSSRIGDYSVSAWTTTDASGCTTLDSVAYGFGPFEGIFDDKRDRACYAFVGSVGDQLTLTTANLSNPSSPPTAHLVQPDGTQQCGGSGQLYPCTLDTPGRHVVIVEPYYSSLGSYRLSAACGNPACGPEELTVAGLLPTSSGQAADVTVELRGRALSLDETVTLKRAGSADIEGRSVSVSADRRALSVIFDLSTAALGAWDVVITGPGHPTKTVTSGFSVTGVKRPSMQVSIVGRSAFVPGRTQTLTIGYENTGNIDAIGTPVFISGLPAGTEITPKFQLTHFDPVLRTYSALPWDQSKSVYPLADGSLELFVMLGRVPGGGKGTLTYSVKIPTMTSYTLVVGSGVCLNTPASPAAAAASGSALRPGTAAAFGSIGGGGGSACMGALVGVASNFLPGGPCVSVANGVASTVVADSVSGVTPYSGMDGVDVMSTGLGAAACVASLVPGGQVVSGVLGALGAGLGALKSGWSAGAGCSESGGELDQQAVASMDPNEIIGPIGGGATHAIRGDGKLTYAIYFENKSTATAPAQEVRITDVLNPAVFDLATVEFGRVQWGATSYVPPSVADELDDVVDLRPGKDLKVAITASKQANGTLEWLLASVDPATGILPEDPAMGFLPPNDALNNGQGVVYVSVALKNPADAATVTNKATIVFDLNAPIETNVWSNLVDRTAPSSTVAALEAQTLSASIPVSWAGTDATSAVAGYTVAVSVDGGDYQLWKEGTSDTSGTYSGAVGHTYAFTSVAIDHAGNTEPMPPTPDATTAVVAALPLNPTVAPSTSGTARVGGRLTVSAGSWPVAVTSSYQWLRAGVAIPGATGTAYVPTAADLGKAVSVRVSASAPQRTPAVVTTSPVTVTLGLALRATKVPVIAGIAKVGKKLTARPGTWSPAGTRYLYQWRANGKAIKKATKATFALTRAFVDKKLSVTVTAVRPGHASGKATSRPTKPVAR